MSVAIQDPQKFHWHDDVCTGKESYLGPTALDAGIPRDSATACSGCQGPRT